MSLRLKGQNCKIFKTPLSRTFQKRLVKKENQTKYRKMTRKPRSNVSILMYRTWAITLKNVQKKSYERKERDTSYFDMDLLNINN